MICDTCCTDLAPDVDRCPECGASVAEACPCCGEPYRVELAEYWPESRTFLLDCCCEGSHDDAVQWLDELAEHDPRELGRWLGRELGRPVRQVVADSDGGARYGNAGICVDEGLRLDTIERAEARAWIAKHHRHNEPPNASVFNLAVYNGHELVAVAMVGRPVARLTCERHPDWIEVNRVCVDPELPSWVVWNACSMLYGAAKREAKARGFKRVITYTREDETGHTLKAAGWTQTHRTKLDRRNWARKGRAAKTTRLTPCRKIRWEVGTDKRERKAVAADGRAFAELTAKREAREAKLAA